MTAAARLPCRPALRTRRASIRLAGAGLAACAFAAPAAAVPAPAADRPARALLRLFADPRSAAAVGRAWLQGGAAGDPDLAALQAAVLGALRLDAVALRRHGRKALVARFRDRVRQDFAEGAVVMVEGWMLSRVEAEACAIAWLLTAAAAPPASA